MVEIKKGKIVFFGFLFFMFFVVGALSLSAHKFNYRVGGNVASISSYEGMDEVRAKCDLSLGRALDFRNICKELVNDKSVTCIKNEFPIRSSCMKNYIERNLLGGRSKHSFAPCTSPPVKMDWTIKWTENNDGSVDFLWCKK